ncbi:MAG TPA: hypothetical protein VF462_07895, partial [Micromonosporaceae bacterium]
VNLLAIRRPDLIEELVELSAALRAAQRELRGPQLRELSAQRRGAVNALVAQARALAAEEAPGLSASKLPLGEVEATFNAALSDADVAAQVRSGRLVRAATYAGFGEVPRPQLRLVTEEPEAPAKRSAKERETAGTKAAERSRKAAEAARAAQRKALDRELAKARTEQKRTEADLERAAAAERDSTAALAEIEAALADLERRRAEAEQEVSRRKLARKTAERSVVAAGRHAGEAEAAMEALEAEGPAK